MAKKDDFVYPGDVSNEDPGKDAMWTNDTSGGKSERSYSRNSGSNRGDKWTESEDQNLLRQGEDYAVANSPHEVSYVMADIGNHGDSPGLLDSSKYQSNQWQPGALPAGGEPRYSPKGDKTTRPVDAAEPSGKYRKMPGRAGNQRSGD